MKNKKKIIGFIPVIAIIAIVAIFEFVNIVSFSETKSKGANIKNDESFIKKDEQSSKKQIYYESYSPMLSVDYSRKNTINSDSDYIAIVRIDSLETSNWDEINKQYVAVYSKGNATVMNVLKGELPDTISYRRLGGQIEYNKWIVGDVDQVKLQNAIVKPINPEYVIIDSKKADDIHLKVGKTYLVFMKQYSCCNTSNEYTVIAYEYGARELEQAVSTTYSNDLKKVRVKNNVTGNWENIEEVVNFDFAK